jgi:hypothetical protein
LQDFFYILCIDHFFQILPDSIPFHAIFPHFGRDTCQTSKLGLPSIGERFHENPATVHNIGKIAKPLHRGENRQLSDKCVTLPIVANSAKGLQIFQSIISAAAFRQNMIALDSVPIGNPARSTSAVVAGDNGFPYACRDRLFSSHDFLPLGISAFYHPEIRLQAKYFQKYIILYCANTMPKDYFFIRHSFCYIANPMPKYIIPRKSLV